MRRTSDERTFTGWVVSLIGREVTIRVTNALEIEAGEQVTVEVDTPDRLASFFGTVEGGLGDTVDVHIGGEVTYSPPRRQGRLFTTNVFCEIVETNEPLRAKVVDVGPSGIGMLLSKVVPKGRVLSVDLVTGDYKIKGEVTVVYCHDVESERGWYRAGFLISGLSDRDYGIWLGVFNRLDSRDMSSPAA